MATSKRQTKVEQLEAELQKLEGERHLRKEQIDQKEAEQRGYMVAARVHKDATAQGSIDRASEEIAKLQRANLQDYGAAEELRAQIETERAQQAREERRARHEVVLQLLRPRAKGKLEKQLIELAEQMNQVAAELAASDDEIACALRSLDPSFYSEAQNSNYRRTRRRDWLSALLCDVVDTPITRSYGGLVGDPAAAAVETFGRIMRDIEDAAEIEPQSEECHQEAAAVDPSTVAWGGGVNSKLPELPGGVTTTVG